MSFKMSYDTTHKSIQTVIILFLLLFIQSCEEKVAIFASLENEEKIKTSNFPDKASIVGMGKINGRYYVSTGARMFDRETRSQNWGKTKLKHGYSRISKLVQAKVDEPIYFIAYAEKNGEISKEALFKITAEKGVELIKKENKLQSLSITSGGQLFASVSVRGNDDTYTYYGEYEKESPSILAEAADGIILDAAEFQNKTYVLTQTGLRTLQGSEFKDVKASIDKDSDPFILTGRGLLSYSDADKKEQLILTDKNNIWKTEDGKDWEIIKDSTSTFFTDAIYIEQRAFTGLLVGTRIYNFLGKSDGYKELSDDSKSFNTPSGNKYTSGALYKADVLGFFLDEEENIFFVLTKGSGLWRGSYTNTLDIDWFLE